MVKPPIGARTFLSEGRSASESVSGLQRARVGPVMVFFEKFSPVMVLGFLGQEYPRSWEMDLYDLYAL